MRTILLALLIAGCVTLLISLAASSVTGTQEMPGKISTTEQPASAGSGCPYLEQQGDGARTVCPYLKGTEEGCPALPEGTPRCPRAGSGTPGQRSTIAPWAGCEV